MAILGIEKAALALMFCSCVREEDTCRLCVPTFTVYRFGCPGRDVTCKAEKEKELHT